MTFATLQDAQRECNNHAGEFPGWYAAVFEQATDHRFFFMWASTPIELLKAQARHNAYIVSMLVHGERANGFIQWPGEWERRDHFYRYLYAMHLLADETEALSPANKQFADGIALLMRHNHFDEAFRDGGGTFGGEVPEDAPYDWSIELETLFTLMGSDEVADRTNALFILSAWDMKLLPADIRAAILYLARNDKHQIVRQWAEFVLDPLSKPIPPQCGE